MCFTRFVAQSAAPGHGSRDGRLSARFGRRRGVHGERLPVRGCLAKRQLELGYASQVRIYSYYCCVYTDRDRDFSQY